MNVLIVEDEELARQNLANMLAVHHDLNIIGMTDSIQDTVKWLKNTHIQPDVIFMDVELSDGTCFEIFRQFDVQSKIIMTTAYQHYAIKAFEVNSIDYLLKPVDESTLERAVQRCRENLIVTDIRNLIEQHEKHYKNKFLIKFNNKIIPVKVEDIVWIYSEEKNTYIVTRNKDRLIIDCSLDKIVKELDPEQFFRTSRNCIVSMDAIVSIIKNPFGRLTIMTDPSCDFKMYVSRSRSEEFLEWIENNKSV